MALIISKLFSGKQQQLLQLDLFSSITSNPINRNMVWVYQAGNQWIPLDDSSSAMIDRYFSLHRPGEILVHRLYRAWVDPSALYLRFLSNGVHAQIARVGY
ncbi:hypothetical protein BDB00DRAFT_876250 [Zychaea mexicana]|uniref:uncharacterized protein n=1 Tax=Zychaea mexicana TaxID=64656 RepID=UPI0022FE32D9|nr:uncharacterized protein BDB00DRAFT_876250 [Zychaea mexicana]KAI9489593.1 hypothetical protein BDB00DRAFT_876250 [Zychaea mexicana]